MDEYPLGGPPRRDPFEVNQPRRDPFEPQARRVPVEAARPESRRRRESKPVAIDPLTGEPIPQPAKPRRLLPVSPRRWRNIALALGLMVATMAGATGRLLTSDFNPSAIATPVRTAAPTPSPIAFQSPSPTISPSPTVASPSPTILNASKATVIFRDLMLDTTATTKKTFTFTTDGQGSVSAQVIAAAPLEKISFCMSVNEGQESCKTGATPGFNEPTPPGDHSDWIFTLSATKTNSTPIVDVVFSWPEAKPSLTLTHCRFQGLPNPDSLRGFDVQFVTRNFGTATLSASWTVAKTKAVLTATDISTSPPTKLEQKSWASARSLEPPYSRDVVAEKTYDFLLQNSAADGGRPELTMTLTFP